MNINSTSHDKMPLLVKLSPLASSHSVTPAAAAAMTFCGERVINDYASSCIQDSVRSRLKPWELTLIKGDAMEEYIRLKKASERRELERDESIARDELIDEAMSLFTAFAALRLEKEGELLNNRSLRRLLERLQRRLTLQQRQHDRHEKDLLEEGRREWRREQEEAARLKELEQAMAKWRRECEASLRAATVFLMGMEARERKDEVAAQEAAWAALCAQGLVDRAEAERIAYERFFNSPEQVALRKEQEMKEAAANRLAKRRMKLFLKEQESFVKSCKHARGHKSYFEGAAPKKLCVSCGVKFDDELGYYVRLRGKTIAPPSALGSSQSPAADGDEKRGNVTTLPRITQELEQKERRQGSESASKKKCGLKNAGLGKKT